MHRLPRRLHLDIPLYLPLNRELLWHKLLQWAVHVVAVGESIVVGDGVKRENLGAAVYSGNERDVHEVTVVVIAAAAVAAGDNLE